MGIHFMKLKLKYKFSLVFVKDLNYVISEEAAIKERTEIFLSSSEKCLPEDTKSTLIHEYIIIKISLRFLYFLSMLFLPQTAAM